MHDDALLRIDNLRTYFDTPEGVVRAVDGVSFGIGKGETLALVGESGCGKTVTSLSLIRLLPDTASVDADRIMIDGKESLGFSAQQARELRGKTISMIFQEPMTSLNPVYRIDKQLGEVFLLHEPRLTKAEVRERSIAILHKVGVPKPDERLRSYPHELSGGLRQRVMIAISLAPNPKMLIADEPTTALDVTVQAQILDLLRNLARESGMGVILITHDLGVVAGMTDRVAVMYAGKIVEMAATDELYAHPAHPYTHGLLRSIPQLESGWDEPVPTIPGSVQGAERQTGCRFAPRCAKASEACRVPPSLEDLGGGHLVSCWNAP